MEPVIETYTVQVGEGFEFIANKLGINYYQLLAANPQIDNVQLIKTGDTIYLPIKETPYNTVYIVQKDDTLMMGVAKKMNVPYQDLLRDNPHIKNPDYILPGYRLRIRTQYQYPNDNDSPLSICTPTACENDQFIVQIIGKNHPPGQKVYIANHQGQNQGKAFSPDSIPESPSTLLSQLLCWEWDRIKNKNYQLWLEIQTTGAPIKLPLLDNLKHTERQLDLQDNQIVPIVPLTPLRSANLIRNLYTRSNHLQDCDVFDPAHVRSGWLYIYKSGRLWRELEIRQTQTDVTYHDVRLYQDPTNLQEQITADRRNAEGLGLKEIWLPSRWNTQNQADLEFMYSEVQLCAARINYLQENNSVRIKRTQKIDLTAATNIYNPIKRALEQSQRGQSTFIQSNDLAKSFTSDFSVIKQTLNLRSSLITKSFPINMVPAQRIRNTPYELLLDYPAQYLQHQQDDYLITALDDGKQYIQQYLHHRNSFLLEPPRSNSRFPASIAAVATAIEEIVEPKRQPPETQEPLQKRTQEIITNGNKKNLADQLTLWGTRETFTNILADAQQRQIIGILLEDPIHRYRQLRLQLSSAQDAANLASELATYNQNYNSAVLVENIIRPEKIGEDENPLAAYYKKNTEKINQLAIDQALASGPRYYTRLSYDYAHKKLFEEFENSRSELAIDDLTSLNGIDYLGALAFIGALLKSVIQPLFDAASIDQKPLSQQKYEAIAAATSLPNNSFFKRIWPATKNIAELSIPFTTAPNPCINRGDGVFRASEIHQFSYKQATDINTDTIQLQEVGSWLDQTTQDSTIRTGAKAIGSAITGVITEITKAAIEARDNLTKLQLDGAVINAKLTSIEHRIINNQTRIDQNTAQQSATTTDINQRVGEIQRTNEQITNNRTAQTTTNTDIQSNERLGVEINQETRREQRTANQAATQGHNRASNINWQAQQLRRQIISEGRLAVMEIYTHAGDTLRQTHLGYSELVLNRRGNVNVRDFYILFEEAIDNAQHQAVRVNGTLNAQGQLQATTNIEEARRSRMERIKADDYVWMLPQNHQMAINLRNYYRLEREAYLASNEVRQEMSEALSRASQLQSMSVEMDGIINQQRAELKQLELDQLQLTHQKQALQQQIQRAGSKSIALEAKEQELTRQQAQLDQQKIAIENEIKTNEKAVADQQKITEANKRLATRTPIIPVLIVALECYNMYREWNNYDESMSQKGRLRSDTTLFGAGLDLYIAADALIERIRNYRAQQVLAYYSTSNQFLTAVVKVITRNAIKSLPAALTLRLGFQTISGGIFAWLSYRDYQDALRVGNRASTGYFMMMSGSLLSMVPLAGGAPILGLTPVGWVALLLILGGALWVMFVNQTEIEKWLVNGPFGSINGVPILKQEQEAYYRLLALLANQQISVQLNPYQEEARQKIVELYSKQQPAAPGLLYYEKANVQVKISSALASMVNPLHLKTMVHFARKTQNFTYIIGARPGEQHWFSMQPTIVKDSPIEYLCKTETAQGIEYYFTIPLSVFPDKATSGTRINRQQIGVRVQMQLKINQQTVYFPIAIDDNTPLDQLLTKVTLTPTFTEGEPYWLSEPPNQDELTYYRGSVK